MNTLGRTVRAGSPAVSRRVLPEYEKTEKPLIEQLVGLGWEHLEGAPPGEPVTDPAPSGRETFTQVVIRGPVPRSRLPDHPRP